MNKIITGKDITMFLHCKDRCVACNCIIIPPAYGGAEDSISHQKRKEKHYELKGNFCDKCNSKKLPKEGKKLPRILKYLHS